MGEGLQALVNLSFIHSSFGRSVSAVHTHAASTVQLWGYAGRAQWCRPVTQGHVGFQAGNGEGVAGASWGTLLPFQQQVVCVGGQVVRTPPPILPEWLMHEAVTAGVIKEMYANS